MEIGSEFVVRGGRRKPLRTWILVLAVILVISVITLASAINQPVSDDPGGAGHVVIPWFGAVFSVLGLAVVFGQWWEDSTYLVVDGERLRVRHGTNRWRGLTTWYDRSTHIALSGEGSRANPALFLTQGEARVRLGDLNAIVPLQSSRLAEWLRAEGFAVDRHWDGLGG